jgi:predicted HTH transcriptional regulator
MVAKMGDLMSYRIDLAELARRESEQTEWKENVADIDDVVATLSAFANDLQNLGGGYVVCGAKEENDAEGFPRLVRTGLTANRLKEVENKVLTRCRERVSPAITPQVEELPADDASHRILVFMQPATGTAHTCRRGNEGARHFVRVSRSTIEARNGALMDLLVRTRVLEPWDRRPCNGATESDLDLVVLRDALQRMGVFSSERGIEHYFSPDTQISPMVPSLCVREPLTNVLRPRNFAILLFGRETQRFIPGAVSLFSLYPGIDRSDPHAERHELAGNLLEQARRLTELLDVQSYTAFDKEDPAAPNALKYPKRALHEAMSNALAHRDYELADPTRLTVFANRIEIVSPGTLPTGMDVEAFREGRSGPKWRNQALAWFFTRLQLAQAEGQRIPTILRVMRDEGCPAPTFDVDGTRVLCILPAHPRHAVLRDLQLAAQSLALGELVKAQEQVRAVLRSDPLNFRALQLFSEIQHALRDPEPVIELVEKHIDRIEGLPPTVLVQLVEELASDRGPASDRSLARRLLHAATRGRLEERELRRIAVAVIRAHDGQGAIALIERQLMEHPEWERHASLKQLRGDALLGLAKRYRVTAKKPGVAAATRATAWKEFHAYLARAERELQEALSLSVDAAMTQQIHRNIDILRDGKVAAKAGPHMRARQVFWRDKIVAAREHKRAAGMSAAEEVADYMRDAAFTTKKVIAQ